MQPNSSRSQTATQRPGPVSSNVRLHMNKKYLLPPWHVLLHQWLIQGRGNTGLTLSFLAGALALSQNKGTVSSTELRQLVDEMIRDPVSGYFVGARRCRDIQAIVLSSLPENDGLIHQCELFSPRGQLSFAFSPDAMSLYGGLDCKGSSDCIDNLIADTIPQCESGNFSRIFHPTSHCFVYAGFQSDEIEFVRSILG